ncbi:hypothetical protein DYBT9623_05446 [Dyadobacter sp. CECT 9623]|uniref:DUF4595 domain-containing protein n=1 Tax=Dyadobacter linearis TaxID=2823330 RepID=A0ABM8UYK1_9BACT|nr:hypothetical protein [Dyadobacter sp. CECT 9623]CAG5074758.1 hypothetical protein DYBT9623_05446 [Dyadobacter sp. CECT 9623]
MKNQVTKHSVIVLIITALIILGCKKDTDPDRQIERCKLASYLINGYPTHIIYDEDGFLLSRNDINPDKKGIICDQDIKGNLSRVLNHSDLILGDTLIADYVYVEGNLQTLRYYDRQYDINGGPSKKQILTCNFYYGKSEKPDSMQVIKSRVDSSGNEYPYEPTRIDRFSYDNNGNLTKQEIVKQELNGRFMLASINYHTYDSKPNYLKKMKQIYFFIDQSIPYMFSKNNLLSTRREVPGKLTSEISYKVIYDGDMVKNDGMGFSEMKWSCE